LGYWKDRTILSISLLASLRPCLSEISNLFSTAVWVVLKRAWWFGIFNYD
jgi:hypothetical protein